MIDEIDKMGTDFRGDPASAMLEVLDPEQNHSFRDHYLDLPFDLSNVMFITTANILEAIPAPLRDRMEVIQLSGYTAEEKHEIARRYLVPRQIERNGLAPEQVDIKDEVIDIVIREYTREAGVRNLERELGTLCRKVAREFAEGRAKRKVTVTPAKARAMLGRRRFFSESRLRTKRAGCRHGPRVDSGRRRGAVRRGDPVRRFGQADHHRAARRRDARVRAGGAVVRARAHRPAEARSARGLLPDARPPHPRAGRGDPEGRALGRRHDGHRARPR